MGEKDISEKMLEAYNDVFADIVNVLVFQGEQVIQENDLTDASPLSVYKADQELHQQERDVSKYWNRANIRLTLLGFENQTAYDPDLPLRVIGYDGAGYRAQLLDGRKERYPVITLVLYFGTSHWSNRRSLRDALTFPPEVEDRILPLFNDYQMNLYEISYLTEEQIAMFRSDFKLVAEYFVKSRTDKAYQPSEDELRHVDAVLKLLSVMTGDNRFEDLLKSPEGGKIKTMSNVLDFREARGRAEGEARGRILGTVETCRDLGFSNADIIKRLIEKFGLSQNEAEAYVLVSA